MNLQVIDIRPAPYGRVQVTVRREEDGREFSACAWNSAHEAEWRARARAQDADRESRNPE